MTAAAPDKSKIHPMAYYYLGYFAEKLGAQKASEYYRLAVSMPPDYVFPFQNEAIDVLRAAIQANPRDARAPYYLGNLLYDWQPEEAAKLWETSAALDPSFAIVHRNLATAYMHQKPAGDLNRAIAELEHAVSLDRKYPLHFTELDELYEQAGTPIEKRLPLFEKNRDVVAQRDDAQNRAIALKVAAGKYDEAIAMMTGRQFAVVEGANLNVAEHWTDAHILRGQRNIAAKRYTEALADLQAALTVPSNLAARGWRRGGARGAEIAYWTGVAYQGMSDRAKATESWNRRAAHPGRRGPARRHGRRRPCRRRVTILLPGALPAETRTGRPGQGAVPGPRGLRPTSLNRRPRGSRPGGRGGAGQTPRARSGQRALPHRPRLPGSR